MEYASDEIVEFKKFEKGKPLLAYIYKPKKITKEPLPCIVFFFGGGWQNGSPKQFFQQSDYFRHHGIFAISAEYRTLKSHNAIPQLAVEDAKSLIRWIRKNASKLGIYPDGIIASGGSTGGHLAACAGIIDGFDEPSEDKMISSRPSAMVLFNPVLDTTTNGYGANLVGSNKTEISPCHHIKGGVPPTLIFHGDKDRIVPYENAIRFTNLMKESGNICKLVTFFGRDHGFFNSSFFKPINKDEDYDKTMQDARQWLTDIGILRALYSF